MVHFTDNTYYKSYQKTYRKLKTEPLTNVGSLKVQQHPRRRNTRTNLSGQQAACVRDPFRRFTKARLCDWLFGIW